MQINVVKNAKKNIIFGAVNRIIILILPFVERTVIQYVLGSQYLGLGSLFNSIIQVLSLTELGFSSAMVYNMYKPAAENDIQKMNALLKYYRLVYRIIGFVILILGSIIIPLLPRLIHGSYPRDINLTILYIIYLINTSLSYFLYAYLNSVIVVHQREDIRSFTNSIIRIGLTTSQILLIMITKNYYYMVVMMPVFTIINNLWVGNLVKKSFPQYKPEGNISPEDRKDIQKLVTGTFIQQACSVTRNSLDSVCISAFLGLTITAIYNNYYLILSGITSCVGIFTASFVGGVGNHVATRNIDDNFEEMKKLDFVYLWISGFCTICLLCLYQPFMKMWMGDEMLLPYSAIILFCIYFYLLKMGDIRSIYSTANGLWWHERYRAICETILNLVLNITLGKLWGINGIIIATILSIFICNYIWSVSITFNIYFGKDKKNKYYLYQARQTIIMIFASILCFWLCSLLPYNNSILSLFERVAICAVVSNLVFFIVFRKSGQFQYALKLLKMFTNDKKHLK